MPRVLVTPNIIRNIPGPYSQTLLQGGFEIVYPPEGAHVDLGAKAGDLSPLMLKLQGGRAPFRWLANGKPLPDLSRRRTQSWMPDGGGYSKLTVIDSMGRAASVGVFVD